MKIVLINVLMVIFMASCAHADVVYKINADVNHYVTYTSDKDNYGVVDKWSSPDETFLTAKGDCEDYVFLKREFLLREGIDNKDLLITYGTTSKGSHMILVVNSQDRFLALDNRFNQVVEFSSIEDFKPLYWFNERGAWLINDFNYGRKFKAEKAIARYLAL